MTLACEDANSKLVDVVTFADEDRVGNNLLQIWKLRFGLVKSLKLKFRRDWQLKFGPIFSADVL